MNDAGDKGKVLRRSLLLCATGLIFIVLGFSWLPVIGIFLGAGFLWFGIFPWTKSAHRRDVNVLIGSVSDNYLEDRRIAVAILSAVKERDGFDFDPGRVDPRSVRIGPGRAAPVEDMSDPETCARSLRDINDDGVADLIVYFSGDSAGIKGKVEEVCIRAQTLDGEMVFGCGEMKIGYESVLMRKLEYM